MLPLKHKFLAQNFVYAMQLALNESLLTTIIVVISQFSLLLNMHLQKII